MGLGDLFASHLHIRASLLSGGHATLAVALASPEVAVIVAVPLAIAVTRPADANIATEAADVVHVTVAPLIVAPF